MISRREAMARKRQKPHKIAERIKREFQADLIADKILEIADGATNVLEAQRRIDRLKQKAGKLAPWKYGEPEFKPEYAEQVRKLCALGVIDFGLADFFEVDLPTLNRWRWEYPEFREAIKMGWETAKGNGALDDRVEGTIASLLARRGTKIG
jgi:hypothetical protein